MHTIISHNCIKYKNRKLQHSQKIKCQANTRGDKWPTPEKRNGAQNVPKAPPLATPPISQLHKLQTLFIVQC